MLSLSVLMLAVGAESGVVITEIMYDPASPERSGEAEWVEIANLSPEPVTMKGWRLDDEDGGDWGPFDATLRPRQVAVLINGDATGSEEFLAAWTDDPTREPDFLIIPVSWGSLANRPTADNEILTLLDGDGTVAAKANYQQANGWPPHDRSGASIYMPIPSHASMNVGSDWARSKAGVHGARACRPGGVFSRPDIGSPGTISQTASPTPPATPVKPDPTPPPTTPKAPPAPSPAPAEPRTPDPTPPDDDDIPY